MFYSLLYIFFFNDTPTTEIYTLSLHDALPISKRSSSIGSPVGKRCSKSVRWPIGPGRKSGSTPALVAWLICRSTMRVTPASAANLAPLFPRIQVMHGPAVGAGASSSAAFTRFRSVAHDATVDRIRHRSGRRPDRHRRRQFHGARPFTF